MKGLTNKQRYQLLKIADNVQMGTGSPVGDEIAFVTLMRICRDYVTRQSCLRGADEERLYKRLEAFRIRFYEKI